jgi:phosphate transport system permease protein
MRTRDAAREWTKSLDRRDAAWWSDFAARLVAFLGAISAIVAIVAICWFLLQQGFHFATHRLSLELLLGETWAPAASPPSYGALPLIAGSAWTTLTALLVGGVTSLGAAIFVAEVLEGRPREFIKVLIELLAAVPSVVWGTVGILVLQPVLRDVFGAPQGLNLLNAGIVLGLMAAPIMTTIAEDALRAVPDSYREAAQSLGATRWQVVRHVVLPQARPGLSAALLLGLGRAVGEAIAVLMVSGHIAQMPSSPLDAVATIPATIAGEFRGAPAGSDHKQALFFLGFVLFSITFAINLAADRIVRGRRRTS